nr:MAG TPA: chromosome segregation protein [Caudoviricetes sp.]
MPYGNYQWDESARTVSRETQGYECRMSKTLTYASEFAGSIKDKCTCRVHSLDFDFLSQVSSWIKDTYPDREIFGSFSKDIRASDYGSDGRYCLTITCTQNLKGVAAKRELLDQFFTPNGSRKDMTPQQEMEKILADIKKAKEIFSCTPAQNADAAATMTSPAASSSAAAIPTTSESGADANGLTPALSPQSSASAPVVPAETSFASAAVPTFDFSALGDLSQQAADADQQFDLHYGAAQDEYLISCIYLARIHTLTAKAGRYGGGTWTKWYESKGLGEGSVRRMIQNGEAFNSANLAELKQLPELTRRDLNLIARSGCAGQLVEAAGDSQRVQELLAQLKAEKDRADTAEKSAQNARKENAYFKELVKSAEAQTSKDAEKREEAESRYESALADISGLKEQNAQLKERADSAEAREEEAWKMQSKAEARAKDAESQLEAAHADIDGLQEQYAQMSQRANDAEEALKHQPIVGVIDEEEVDRRAAEKAWGLADARNAELAKDNASLKKQLAALRAKVSDDAQADFETANFCVNSIRAAWDTSRASYARLVGEDLEGTFQSLCGVLNSIMEEAARLCRQPPDYDGGDGDE